MTISLPAPDKLFKLLLAMGLVLISFPVLCWWQPAVSTVPPAFRDSLLDASWYKPGVAVNRQTEFPSSVIPRQGSLYLVQGSQATDRRIAKWRQAVKAQRKTIEAFARTEGVGLSFSVPPFSDKKGSTNSAVVQNLQLDAGSRNLMLQRMVQAQRKLATQGSILQP